METGFDVLQILLLAVSLSFLILSMGTVALLHSTQPAIVHFAQQLQANGLGQFLLYLFIISGTIALIGYLGVIALRGLFQSPSRDSQKHQ